MKESKIAIANKRIAKINDLIGFAEKLAEKEISVQTRKAYQCDWQHFEAWCQKMGAEALPARPEVLALYLTHLAKTPGETTGKPLKVSTINRRIATINRKHREQGHHPLPTRHPAVEKLLKGIRRELTVAQAAKKPLLIEHIREILAVIPDNLPGMRDKALLLLGISGFFRRSELVNIQVEQIRFTKEGMIIHLPFSKTDQEGEGHQRAIPFGKSVKSCPVKSLQDWLMAANIKNGAVFRPISKSGKLKNQKLGDRSVALVIKKYCLLIGLNPKDYAGHSLRAGGATQAAMNGASERAIMKHGNWKKRATLDRYVRDGNLFRENAADKLEL